MLGEPILSYVIPEGIGTGVLATDCRSRQAGVEPARLGVTTGIVRTLKGA